jgi:hypothetical protein
LLLGTNVYPEGRTFFQVALARLGRESGIFWFFFSFPHHSSAEPQLAHPGDEFAVVTNHPFHYIASILIFDLTSVSSFISGPGLPDFSLFNQPKRVKNYQTSTT